MDIGRVGIWWSGSWRADGMDAAAEMEELGYRTLWLSNGFGDGLVDRFERLLSATKSAVVASGVVSIWHTPPTRVVQDLDVIDEDRRQRFLLGLGVRSCFTVFGFQGAVGDHVRSHEILDEAADSATADAMVQAAVDVVCDGDGKLAPHGAPLQSPMLTYAPNPRVAHWPGRTAATHPKRIRV